MEGKTLGVLQGTSMVYRCQFGTQCCFSLSGEFEHTEIFQDSTTSIIKCREEDEPSTIINVSVLGVSCQCVEHPSQSIFATCEFESATINLKLRQFGSDFHCTLKNLQIFDLSAEHGTHRRLFGVMPGEKYLLSITTSTTDKSASFFDGYSLDLHVDIGSVEMECFIGKLLRIFYWIFDGLIDTLTASPIYVPKQTPELHVLVDVPKVESAKFAHNGRDDDLSLLLRSSSVLHGQPACRSPVVTRPTQTTVLDFSQRPPCYDASSKGRLCNARFRNDGERVLARWMMRASQCRPKLGLEECRYLEQRCGFDLPEHQKRKITNDVNPNNLIPILTLRKYRITFTKSSLIIPINAIDPRHARLAIDSIIITNSPKLSKTYGLLDNIQIKLNNVTIQQGTLNQYLLSSVDIDVHFLRASLNVTPPSPKWMQFGFSDVPWFITPDRLNLLFEILNQNVLGDDPDIIASLKKAAARGMVTNRMSVIPPRPGSFDTNEVFEKNSTIKEETFDAADTQQESIPLSSIQPVHFTSLFQISLPGLFLFLTPDPKIRPQSATVCFHADLLQVRHT